MKTGRIIAIVIMIAVIALALGVTVEHGVFSGTESSSLGSQTSFDITFTASCYPSPCSTITSQFYYPISINYSGSWNLVYWVENYGTSPTDITNQYLGNISGSGNYETTITFYVVGYVEKTLCANATKLDNSQENLTLSVLPTGVSGENTNSTTISNPTAKVCASMAV